jgi:Tol biopolymer transport system component
MTPAQTSQSPSWSPDGSQITYASGLSSNRLWIVEFDGSGFGEAFPYRFGSAPSWR